MAEHYEKDEMRLCPTCRVPISVLATRCRHCGVEVSRPRKEEKQLTLKDLGGDKASNYTISGNVMDALEAFREEQLNSQEQERIQREQASGTWFGRKPVAPPSGQRRPDDLPELDQTSRELADLGPVQTVDDLVTPSTRQARPRRNLGPTPQERLMQVGGGLLALVVLYFMATWGWGRYQNYLAEQEALRNPVYVSQALSMLESGRPLVSCLEEAVKAVGMTDSPENRAALEQVRQRVLDEIKKLLNAPAYSRETLDQASVLSARAAEIDDDPRLQDLNHEVKDDINAHTLILVEINVTSQRAKFKVHDPSAAEREQEVGVGDYVGGRFVVQSIIEGQVRLVDSKRRSPTGQRAIIARITAPVSAA